MVKVTIHRGTHVTPEGSYGPGQEVEVDEVEAARLKALGFVKPDDFQAPAEVQDGGLKIESQDGSQVKVS